MTVAGHTLSAIYGAGEQRWATCSCGERLEGPTTEAVVAEHEAHTASLATHAGLARSRRALADAVRKGKPT